MIATTVLSKRNGMGLAAGIGLAAFISLALGGCASQQVSQASSDIAVSDAMLANAIGADAARVAPEEIAAARTEIDMARRALEDDEYDMASLIAREAQVDASLAESRARAAAAQAAADALHENMRILRSELNQPE